MQQDKENNSITEKYFTADVSIKDLILDKNNPRKIDKQQFEKLVQSLKDDPDFIFKRPILVNRINNEFHVYAGNQRVKAAKKLGWKTIRCIIDDNLPENIIKQRIVKDNAHYGEFDWDMLANEWDITDLLMSGLTENNLQLNFELDTDTEDKQNKRKNLNVALTADTNSNATKAKPLNKSPGVPPKPIDWNKVDELLICGCLTTEIAAACGISTDTLYNRCQTDKGANFSAYSTEKKQHGDGLLRAAQYKKAVKGDNSMMIWLGKNRLDQRDTPSEITINPEAMKGVSAFLAQLEESRSALNKAKIINNNDEKSE